MKFVFDLDGTLCFDGQSIPAPIHAILSKAATYRHQLIFATTRSYRDCISVLGDKLAQETVVGLNGGVVYHKGKLVTHSLLDKKAYTEALSWCKDYNLPYFIEDDFNYVWSNAEKLPFYAKINQTQLAQPITLENLAHPVKMVISFGQHEDILEDVTHALKAIDTLELTYHSDDRCLHLTPSGVTKANTLLDILGDTFVAFGNDKNDKAMLKAALYSIQVGQKAGLEKYVDERIPTDGAAVADKIQYLFTQFEGR